MENLLASLDKENASPGDLKELFNVCLGPEAPLDPELLPPRWPARSERMRYAWTEYYRALQRLSEELYGVCALALGLVRPQLRTPAAAPAAAAASDTHPSAPRSPSTGSPTRSAATATACARSTIPSSGTRRRRGSCARRRTPTTAR